MNLADEAYKVAITIANTKPNLDGQPLYIKIRVTLARYVLKFKIWWITILYKIRSKI